MFTPKYGLVFLLFAASVGRAATIVVTGPTLAADDTWTTGNTYHFSGSDLTIAAGVTLTIQPGVVVKFNNGRDLFVDGTINAVGTAGMPIIFTSVNDDTIGDDIDMAPSVPAQGDWGNINTNAGSVVTLQDVEVRYGGDSTFGWNGAVTIDPSSTVSILDAIIRDSQRAGIDLNDADPTIGNVTFQNNADGGIRMTVNSNPALTNATFVNNGFNGVEVEGGTIIGATAWDDPSAVYHLIGHATVDTGATLTIGPGQIIKSASSRDLFVDGTLAINGTSANPVRWTSLFNDAVGGDSNNDGNATMPSPGDWRRMQINAGGNANIAYLQSSFGADNPFGLGLMTILSDAVTIVNSDFSDSVAAGINIIDADPDISFATFTNNQFGALRMSAVSDPILSDLTFTNNGVNGVEVTGGTPAEDMVWDDAAATYHLISNLTVDAGRTLTIGAGQVVKAGGSRDILVNGNLVVSATAGNPAVYTSTSDDSVGGDSNNDGNATMPSPGNWRRIEINPGATASISGWNLAYGGQSPFGNGLLTIETPGVVVVDSVFENSGVHGINLVDADANVSGSTFRNNASAAINMSASSDARFSDLDFSNNATNGVRIQGGTLANDVFWNSSDVVYAVNSDITVPAGRTLDVSNGQIIKMGNNAGIFVGGTINATGVPDSPVVFTSLRDDLHGGDTNNDGNSQQPSAGLWDHIRLDASGNGQFDSVEVHFAGISSGNNAAIDISGTAQIDNTLITRSSASAIHVRNGGFASGTNVVAASSATGITVSGAASMLDLINVTIDRNGKGVIVDAGTFSLINALISNAATVGIEGLSGPSLNLESSALFNPDASSGDFTGIADPIGQMGNISGPIAFVNPLANDYRPLFGTVGIDAGDGNAATDFDLLGRPRFDNPLVANTGSGGVPFVDMGAVEAQDGIPGDLIDIANGDAGDQLGMSVSADGNRLAVGVPFGNGSGQVLIFAVDGEAATPVATIDVPAGFAAAEFGASIDLQGEEIAIGAPGTSSMPIPKGATALQAALFERLGQGDWRIKVPVATTSGNMGDRFGAAVSLNGSMMAVGAPGDSEGGVVDSGAVYAFELGASSVVDNTKIKPFNPQTGAAFGTALATQSNQLVVGAPGSPLAGALAGSATLFEQIGNNLASLTPMVTVQGGDSGPGARFGQSVALEGDRMAIGAPMEDVNGNAEAGAAYVFDSIGGYSQLGRLVALQPAVQTHIGMQVAFDGSGLAVGGPGFAGGSGAVWRFDRSFNEVERIDAPAGATGFGASLAIDGNLFAIGAPATQTDQGAAFSRLRDVTAIFGSGFERASP